jgi:hypothetical protein
MCFPGIEPSNFEVAAGLARLGFWMSFWVFQNYRFLGFCYIFQYFFSFFLQIVQIFIFNLRKRLPIDKIVYFHQTS